MHWEIHPPRPSRFPSGGDFAPLGPRDCPRASPSGNLSGLGVQNPRPREISRASGDVFPNTSLLSAVYGYNMCGFSFSCFSVCRSQQSKSVPLTWIIGSLSCLQHHWAVEDILVKFSTNYVLTTKLPLYSICNAYY